MTDENGIATPTGWFKARASEVCEKIQDGTHFSPKTQLTAGQYPYVTAKNVRPSGLDLRDITYLSEQDHREIYARCDCRKGDVLLVKDGVNTGDAAINSFDGEISLLSSVCMLRPRAEVLDARFLRYYLQSPQCAPFLLGGMTGTAIRRIILKRIKALPVLACAIPEQREIVATIESYFTRLDDAVATLERVQRNLKRYRASVLKAAVEGRLVPTEAELARAEGRSYEPAAVLLTRILAERRRRWEEAELAKMKAKGKVPKDDKWKAKYVEPVAPETSELADLPEGWCWASVEQLGFIASGQTPSGVTSAGATAGAIPWFRIGDMNTPGNEWQMNVAKEWLTADQVTALGLHVRPAGTIIFPKRGGAIGTNKKRLLARPSTYDLNTMGVVPIGGIGNFLWLWFNSVDLGSLADGSNVPQINHGDIAPLAIRLPPEDEQARIVDEVNALLSVADDAISVVSANRRRAGRLRQSILKWAFEGRLVDQDPTDEPASVLLERIGADRAANSESDRERRQARRRPRVKAASRE